MMNKGELYIQALSKFVTLLGTEGEEFTDCTIHLKKSDMEGQDLCEKNSMVNCSISIGKYSSKLPHCADEVICTATADIACNYQVDFGEGHVLPENCMPIKE